MNFSTLLKIIVWNKLGKPRMNGSSTEMNVVYDKLVKPFAVTVAKSIGFSYELITPSDGQIGRFLPDGNWTGMFGMLQRGEGDIIVHQLAVTRQRRQLLLYSYPFDIVHATFMTRNPKYVPQLMQFLHPFSHAVWISFSACIVLIAFTFHLLLKKKSSFLKIFLTAYGAFMHQSVNFKLKVLSEYVLVASWTICMGFLSYSYSAVLLSFLTFPPLVGVRTILELSASVSRGNHKCITYPGSFIVDALLHSSDPVIQIIGRDLQSHVGSMNIESVLQNSLDEKIPAFIGNSYDFENFKDIYFVSDDSFFSNQLALGMHKKFCCKKRLDKALLRITAAGLYQKLVKDYNFYNSAKMRVRSSYEHSEDKQEKTLHLADLEGVFYLLIIGLSLAFLAFIIELISVML